MPHDIFTFKETHTVQIARKQKNEKNYKINDYLENILSYIFISNNQTRIHRILHFLLKCSLSASDWRYTFLFAWLNNEAIGSPLL